MPHSHAILLTRRVSDDELRQFVQAEGGQWQDGPPLSQGVWEEGPRAVLFLSGWQAEANLATYTPEELAAAEHACGKPIVGHLSVDRSRGPQGEALARRVIAKILSRWQGCEIDGG
jgi:hypothetical protein